MTSRPDVDTTHHAFGRAGHIGRINLQPDLPRSVSKGCSFLLCTYIVNGCNVEQDGGSQVEEDDES